MTFMASLTISKTQRRRTSFAARRSAADEPLRRAATTSQADRLSPDVLNRKPAGTMTEDSALADHYRNPRNLGDLDAPDAVAIVHNPACGDMLRLAVSVEGDRITAVRFKAYGCAAAIAACSVMTELIAGTSLDEAASLGDEDIIAVLGALPPLKVHAVVLAREGAQQAVARVREKRSI
jgi:nitrogen fixation NifU-like protein